jgi:2-polyprenyl-3-methyl-5-hydroxy-6-metoxy-1,4-benzoquinol methylase
VGYSPLELCPLVLPLVAGRRILDLGCGLGQWGFLLRSRCDPNDPAGPPQVTGVDAHEASVRFCSGLGVYADLHASDAVEFLEGQPPAAFDTVLAIELIEHLERGRGALLLDGIVRVAAQVAIVSTPNWESFRPGAATAAGYNPYEHHLSRWTPKDFRSKGFTVVGVGHRLRMWPIRGVIRLLDLLPVLDGALAGAARQAPALGRHLLAYRRA